MENSAPLAVNIKQLLLLFLSLILLSMYSCKKEEPMVPSKNGESKFLIFNSDSLYVVGKVIGDPADRFLYPNIPYEVSAGQRILFLKQGEENNNNAVFFTIKADVGIYNYFTPNNQYHCLLRNEYVIIIK